MPSACGCPTAGIGRPGRRIAMRACVQAAIGEGDHMVDDIGEHFRKPVVKTLPLTPRGPRLYALVAGLGVRHKRDLRLAAVRADHPRAGGQTTNRPAPGPFFGWLMPQRG